jgi:hypothetical protein
MESSRTREALLAPIAESLAGKGIPAVLWGNFLLTVHGVPSIVGARLLLHSVGFLLCAQSQTDSYQEADFIVNDSLLPTAIAVLMGSEELKLTPCLEPEICHISKTDRPSPAPAFHAHRLDSDVHVAIHAQSATLGTVLAPLMVNQDEDLLSMGLIPASHPSLPQPDELGLGHGALSPKDDGSPSPVWVLPSHTYLEAIVRLIRDDENKYVTYFLATVIYFMEYVAPRGFLDEGKLSQACLDFWKDINNEDTPSSDAIKHLREGRA